MPFSVTPHRLYGTVNLVPSDAEVCRFLAAAAFASRECAIRCSGFGPNSEQMILLLRKLGAQITAAEGEIRVVPLWNRLPDQPDLDFGASELCLKLLLPAVCRLRSGIRFSGVEDRKHGAQCLTEVLERHGCVFDTDRFPFYADGFPDEGIYEFPRLPDPDSLFGLALMLCLCPDRGQIVCEEPFGTAHRSVMRILNLFGAQAEETLKGFFFPAGQLTPSSDVLSPRGDPATAGLLLSAGALSGPVTVCGADPSDPDLSVMLSVAESGGCKIVTEGSCVSVYRDGETAFLPEYFDVSPGSLPGLAVLFAGCGASVDLYAKEPHDAAFSASVRGLDQTFAPLGVHFSESEGKCTVSGALSVAGTVHSPFYESLAAALLVACHAPGSVIFDDLASLDRYDSRFVGYFRTLGGVLEEVTPT